MQIMIWNVIEMKSINKEEIQVETLKVKYHDPDLPKLAEIEKGIDNLLNAIQMGIVTSSTKKRLEELASQSGLTVSKYIHKILEEHF